ncbi:class II histocompatibility antigen, B-L beta chain-like [Protopterus annectens]|uniref:class II histocompatibility antigen, B-L beta chain-like n=1 Tax=Protopterus annectens TaxID=7888 RepID=UPI001CFAF768|nr:class II histocompatibility antigen, B-L beta chain-like [Protopterus annectens]XP_043939256.1 class II histocompatibility antigen, B-L beta chain-like [Protopterus annectens]
MLLWNCLSICCSLLLGFHFAAGGFVLQMISECSFSSLEDMQYLYIFTFNNHPFLYFDPIEGMFSSLTPYGYTIARQLNNDAQMLDELKEEINVTCKNDMSEYWKQTVQRKAQPSAKINTIVPKTRALSASLICHVGGFFPPDIAVTWIKNGEVVDQSVHTTPVLPNGDWTYQIRTSVEFTPRISDTYTCMINHISLEQPLLVHWKPGIMYFENYYTVIATAVFVVGLLTFFVGIIYCKTASYGSRYISIPGNTDE